MILALGRSNPLKDFPLTRAAYLALPEPRPRLWLFGIEPELADGLGDRVTYIERPTDERRQRLLNQATVLLQTSKHEGFCLPPLEAMAAGAAVVCTDANGNRDFCRDERQLPDARPHADERPRRARSALLDDARAARPPGRAAATRPPPPTPGRRKLDELDRDLPRARRRREVLTALERAPAPHGGREPVGARPERGARRAHRPVAQRAHGLARQPGRRQPLLAQDAPVGAQLAAGVGRAASRRGASGCDPAVDLAQPAQLVEAAAELRERRGTRASARRRRPGT